MDLNENVKKLLDYLMLYQNLIKTGIFAKENEKTVEKLIKEIEKLEYISKFSSQDLYGFDFKKLKRNFVKIFHPDQFNKKSDIISEPEKTFSKTNATFEEVIECANKYRNIGNSGEGFYCAPDSSQPTSHYTSQSFDFEEEPIFDSSSFYDLFGNSQFVQEESQKNDPVYVDDDDKQLDHEIEDIYTKPLNIFQGTENKYIKQSDYLRMICPISPRIAPSSQSDFEKLYKEYSEKREYYQLVKEVLEQTIKNNTQRIKEKENIISSDDIIEMIYNMNKAKQMKDIQNIDAKSRVLWTAIAEKLRCTESLGRLYFTVCYYDKLIIAMKRRLSLYMDKSQYYKNRIKKDLEHDWNKFKNKIDLENLRLLKTLSIINSLIAFFDNLVNKLEVNCYFKVFNKKR